MIVNKSKLTSDFMSVDVEVSGWAGFRNRYNRNITVVHIEETIHTLLAHTQISERINLRRGKTERENVVTEKDFLRDFSYPPGEWVI